MPSNPHRGVAEKDPRNRGIIEHFRPPEITEQYVRARLTRANPRRTAVEINAQVVKLLSDLAAKPHRPTPPVSQALDLVADPIVGLSTHPDLVTQLWRVDSGLPASCRWLLWGYPALVHPRTGVIFAIAFGTIGIVLRLPPEMRADSAAIRPRQPRPALQHLAGWPGMAIPSTQSHRGILPCRLRIRGRSPR
jgi:hypothetical protein